MTTQCLGYQQITSLAAAAGLTVPGDGAGGRANLAVIMAEGQGVRYRDDGTNPTASAGMPLSAGRLFSYAGDLAKIRFVEQSASAKLNIAYYAASAPTEGLSGGDASMATAALSYPQQAAAGRIPGQSGVSAFGAITNCGAGVSNIGCWQPQVDWVLPAAPVAIELLSSSASDGVAGTGARKVLVIGVGPAFALQIETVTMNGTTPIASALTWQAINTMVVFDDPTTGFGTNKTNVGDISARVPGPGALHGFIAAGRGVSLHGRYTVPAGYTWLVSNFFFEGNKAGSASASFSTDTITITPNGLRLGGLPSTQNNGAILQLGLPSVPLAVPEKNTLQFKITSVSVGGLDICCGCTGLLTAN